MLRGTGYGGVGQGRVCAAPVVEVEQEGAVEQVMKGSLPQGGEKIGPDIAIIVGELRKPKSGDTI